jgi:peptidyl-prolyl cis-trans isomerase B (cyclophilin B)
VASSKDRQRALARAKLDRQLARRAARERRKRRVMAGLGAALAVVLIVSGAAWLGGAFDDEPADRAAADLCVWTPRSTETNPDLRDVGLPPTTGIPLSGIAPMTVNTNQGEALAVALDVTSAPCAVASLSHLAQKKFYDNTECHEITTFGALRCGDPSGTGRGGPTYSFFNENVPTVPSAPAGADAPAPEKSSSES